MQRPGEEGRKITFNCRLIAIHAKGERYLSPATMAPAPPDQQTQVEPEHFEARTTLSNGMSAAVGSAAAGVFVSAIQNSISSHDKGAMGVFTRSGSTIGLFAAMGGIFALTDSFVANAREKSDAYNGAAGGCAAGLVAGANGEC